MLWKYIKAKFIIELALLILVAIAFAYFGRQFNGIQNYEGPCSEAQLIETTYEFNGVLYKIYKNEEMNVEGETYCFPVEYRLDNASHLQDGPLPKEDFSMEIHRKAGVTDYMGTLIQTDAGFIIRVNMIIYEDDVPKDFITIIEIKR